MPRLDMTKMTRKQGYEAHQELWFWCADNPTKKKSEYPDWEKHTNNHWDCFPCAVSTCENCIVDWGVVSCLAEGSLYREWEKEKDPKVRAVLADLIATLPFKAR